MWTLLNSARTIMIMKLTPAEFEALKARLPLDQRERLRPDGLLEPATPRLHLCGGLVAPYIVGPRSLDWASPQTSSEQD
jgi:hypothetical protein